METQDLQKLCEFLGQIGCAFGRETREHFKTLDKGVALLQEKYGFITDTLESLVEEVKKLRQEYEAMKVKLAFIIAILAGTASFVGSLLTKFLVH